MTLDLSAEEALALVAFGDRNALCGHMHQHPQIWPRAAELKTKYDIHSEECDQLDLDRFHESLVAAAGAAVRGCEIDQDEGRSLVDTRFFEFSELWCGAKKERGERDKRLNDASEWLRKAASIGKIKVFGRRRSRARLEVAAVNYEEVSAATFADPYREINRDGWITMSRNTPLDQLVTWRRGPSCDFEKVRLHMSEDVCQTLSSEPGDATLIQTSVEPTSPAPPRKTSGNSQVEKDAKILQLMNEAISVKSARGAYDAARLFVDKAQGAGTPESKVKRLARGYKKRFPPEDQTAQSKKTTQS